MTTEIDLRRSRRGSPKETDWGERHECDFFWESSDPDPSRLHDGVYVIGLILIRLLAVEVWEWRLGFQ